MSNTLAVATYSGGLLRILSIRARPTFRSCFNCARLSRMSFACMRASMRWSRDLAGAFAGGFVAATARDTRHPRGDVQTGSFARDNRLLSDQATVAGREPC